MGTFPNLNYTCKFMRGRSHMNVNFVLLILKEIGNYRFTFHPFMGKKTYKCELCPYIFYFEIADPHILRSWGKKLNVNFALLLFPSKKIWRCISPLFMRGRIWSRSYPQTKFDENYGFSEFKFSRSKKNYVQK